MFKWDIKWAQLLCFIVYSFIVFCSLFCASNKPWLTVWWNGFACVVKSNLGRDYFYESPEIALKWLFKFLEISPTLIKNKIDTEKYNKKI